MCIKPELWALAAFVLENLPRIQFRVLYEGPYSLLTNILNKMNRLQSLTLVALLLVCTFSADCPVDASKQPKIQSDSVGLTAQDNKNQGSAQNLIYNYQFDTPFPSAPSVAIGLNEIQASPSATLDLRVTNPKISSSGVYFKAESGSDSQWKTFKINFLASSRSDMELGSTSISSPVINANDNSFNLIYNIKNDLPANGLKAKSFVQGINVYSPNQGQIGIRQDSASISSKQIFFTFSSPLRTSIIRSLTISVIVFNIYTPSVLYADGIIDQNYVVSTLDITIPRHGINELRTYMVGINSFESSTNKPISIYSAVSEKFSIVIGPIDRTQIDYISVSYLILSVIDCGSCVGNPILFEGICQPICPVGYIATKGKCVPINCKEGQKLNEKGQCVVTCNKNEVYQNGACLCADGYYIINRVCDKCPEGFYYDFKALACKPLCGINSVYKAGRCFCNPGFYIINNRCQQCTYGTAYDPISKKCYNMCQANEVYSPAGCVCANGYYKIDGVCSRCPYQRTYDPDTKTCLCGPGLENVYGSCVPVCKQRQARYNGNCVCAKGFYIVDGVCSTCGNNSYYDAARTRCVCKPNMMWVPALGCVGNCTNQQYFSNGKCVDYCSQYYEVYQGGQCVCYPDFERVKGICVASCAPNEYRDTNGQCRCYKGYFKGAYSPLCQPANCPPGTAFDENRFDCISICKYNEFYINGACVCSSNYFRNPYGDCTPQCSSTEVMINGVCQCPAGWARAAMGVCCPIGSGPGKCPPGSIFVYGMCVPPSLCKANEYWCGSGCACNYGYYRIQGQCVPVTPTLVCPPNSQSNGLNCLCKQGYYPVRAGFCEKCTSGLSWDGKICAEAPKCQNGWVWNVQQNRCIFPLSCTANQYWDGTQCRCRQGYYPIQGICSTCPPGTVFDGFKCNAGVTPQYCKDPYSIWNGYYCACMSGYWPLADGKCTSCIDGTYWDGTCCKPINGQYIPLTVAY